MELEESMRENMGKPPGYFTLPSMLDRDNRRESQKDVTLEGVADQKD